VSGRTTWPSKDPNERGCVTGLLRATSCVSTLSVSGAGLQRHASIVAWPEAAAYGLWLAAAGGFAIACAVLVPGARAEYDFFRGGTIVVHIVDRTLLPLPIVQNGVSTAPVVLAYLVAYFLAYGAYERLLLQPDLRRGSLVFAGGAACALLVPLFLSSDPYAYALYGLEAGPLGLDPYSVQAVGVIGNQWGHALLAIFPNATAVARICNYGPGFALLYGALADVLQGLPLLAFLLAERALGALGIATAALGLWWAEPRADRRGRTRSSFAFAFHPLVLFEFVTFAHGDILMLAALAWAYACWRRERFVLAGMLCGVAVCIRVVAIVALAALAVALWRRGVAALGRGAAGAIVAVLALGFAAFSLFGEVSLGGPPVFSAYSAPLLALVTLFGLPSPQTIGVVSGVVAGASLGIGLLYRAARSPSLRPLAWLPLAALVAAPSFFPHYASWFVSMRSLTVDRRVLRVARALSFSAPLSYVVHVDPFPAPGAPAAVQLTVLAAVWLPVLIALVSRRIGPRLPVG